jgi:hypothetical protein
MHLHLKVLRHLTNQPAKRRLANEEIGRLLVLPAKNAARFSTGLSWHQLQST